MTALIERIIAFIAPHHCIACGNEDNILCAGCLGSLPADVKAMCVFCAKPTVSWRVCGECAKRTKLSYVWAANEHEGLVAEVLRQFKFEGARAAAEPLADLLNARLPYVADDTLIVPLPTARNRVRQRGYDHAQLLARRFAKLRGLSVATPLARLHNLRQVGASRIDRQKNAKNAYQLVNAGDVKGKNILLIDDICTTGSSLSSAAKLIKRAGASRVDAAVVAWQKPQR